MKENQSELSEFEKKIEEALKQLVGKSMIINTAALEKVFTFTEILDEILQTDVECMGYLTAPSNTGDISIHDSTYLLDQEVFLTTISMNENGDNETIDKLKERGSKIVGVWHYHNKFGAFSSSQDKEMNKFLFLGLRPQVKVKMADYMPAGKDKNNMHEYQLTHTEERRIDVPSIVTKINPLDGSAEFHELIDLNCAYTLIVDKARKTFQELHYRTWDADRRTYSPQKTLKLELHPKQFTNAADCDVIDLAEVVLERTFYRGKRLKDIPSCAKNFKEVQRKYKGKRIATPQIEPLAESGELIPAEWKSACIVNPEADKLLEKLKSENQSLKNIVESVDLSTAVMFKKISEAGEAWKFTADSTQEIISNVIMRADYLNQRLFPRFLQKLRDYATAGISPEDAKQIADTLGQFKQRGMDVEHLIKLKTIFDELERTFPGNTSEQLIMYLKSFKGTTPKEVQELKEFKANPIGYVKKEFAEKAIRTAEEATSREEHVSQLLEEERRASATLRGRVTELDKNYNTAQERITGLIRQMEEEGAEARTLLESMRTERDGYNSQAEQRLTELETVNNQISELESQLSEIGIELNAKKEEYNQFKNEVEQRLTSANEQLTRVSNELNAKNAELTTTQRNCDELARKYSTEQETAARLQTELTAINSERQNLEQRLTAAETIANELQRQYDDLKAVVESRDGETAELTRQLEGARTESRTSLEAKQAEIGSKESEIRRLAGQYGAIQEELNSVKTERDDYKSQAEQRLTELETVNNQISELESQLTGIRNELGARTLELNAKKEEYSRFKTDSEQRLSSMQEQLTNANNDLNTKNAELTTTQRNCDELARKYSTEQETAARLQTELTAINSGRQNLEQKLTATETMANELQRQYDGLRAAKERGESESSATIQTLRNEIATARQYQATQDTTIRNLTARLEQSHAEYERTIGELRRELETYHERNNTLAAELRGAQQQRETTTAPIGPSLEVTAQTARNKASEVEPLYRDYAVRYREFRDSVLVKESGLICLGEFLSREYGKVETLCLQLENSSQEDRTRGVVWCEKQLNHANEWNRTAQRRGPSYNEQLSRYKEVVGDLCGHLRNRVTERTEELIEVDR